MSYEHKVKPYEHQVHGFEVSRDREFFAYFMEMGTGKSKILIDNIAWLWLRGEITKALIIAPKGVYMNWVNKEIPQHMPDGVEYVMGYWMSVMKAADKAIYEKIWDDGKHVASKLRNILYRKFLARRPHSCVFVIHRECR